MWVNSKVATEISYLRDTGCKGRVVWNSAGHKFCVLDAINVSENHPVSEGRATILLRFAMGGQHRKGHKDTMLPL